ncbi:LLM class flavin-dependent oxidoreductase [Pseudonocardia sp.]|jgi:5,10-methylenetetrahydromethanopterin reductase|uniref:LLM class flavin-dependent oxidoreductase n=1 Tax=Pseudonocardia sp. TaxID=60912 RepID=UPI0031FD905A
MRLGLMLSGARRAPDAVAVARRAEAAGITDIWISEDYFERGAIGVAGAVAVATKTARIGLGVLNPWTRHPMLTAMEVAGVDELAGGRLLLGMGASNRVWMQERCGIPFRAPLRAVDEAVQIVRTALSGEQVAIAGRHFTVDARLSFVPDHSTVPVYLGAKGERALAMAGRIADGVLLSLLSAPPYVAWAREKCGTQLDTAAYVLVSCDPDSPAARAAVRRPLAFYLGVHGEHDITRVAGLDTELAAGFRAGWLAGRPAVDLVDDQIVDTFAVAGDVDGCLDKLARLAAAGLDCAVLRDPGDDGIGGLFTLAAAYTQRTAEARP